MADTPKWPEWLEKVWAKSPIGNENKGESLPKHTWEVLSRLRDVAQIKPGLAELTGFANLWNILFWAAFFHDWGKAACGFQKALREGGRWGHRHEVLSLVFLEWVKDAFTAEEMLALTAAIVSHHKDEGELYHIYPVASADTEDSLAELIAQLDEGELQNLWRWLQEVAPDWIEVLGFDTLGVKMPGNLLSPDQAMAVVKQEGATLIRQWLLKYYQLVSALEDGDRPEWVLPGIILRGGLIEVDHIGSAHAGSIPVLQTGPSELLSTLHIDEQRLYDHQRQALHTAGSAMLIAPTGSGKTEAALLWATEQKKVHRATRIFYTLPYQASMNAMYDRLDSLFPGRVGLLHSRSVLALYRRLMEEETDRHAAERRAHWFQTLAKLRYYPVQVFSPYQMLKAAYQLKGYEAMLVDYVDATFIFDEIHAYDPERLAMILELVAFLRERFNARFLVMSATMPSLIQEKVIRALGKASKISASDELFTQFVRHEFHLLPGDLLSEEGLKHIRDAFAQRKSVLVTCNTVERAQEVYRTLSEYVPQDSMILIHGRFNGQDRLEKEQRIMAATGLRSKERRPVIVVATQVVEVSLNIDLDVLFSDPAPLEALLQRFGRINRGRRVAKAPVHVFSEPADGQKIYLGEMIQRTLEILAERVNGRVIDENAVQGWLDAIYEGEVLEKWEERYEEVAREFREVFLGNMRPFNSNEALEERFDRLFDGAEVVPVTLEKEYQEAYAQSPLEASQFLVPISQHQLHYLRRSRLIRSDGWPPIVDLPYSQEFGLGKPVAVDKG